MPRPRWNPFLSFPRISLALFCVLITPLLFQLSKIRISSETAVLLESDQRNFASYEKALDILRQDTVVVINMECEDVFSPEGISAIHRVSEAFRGQPGFVDAKSLTHSVKPVRDGIAFRMVPLVSPGTSDANELERLRAFSLENPLVRNVMVAPDGKNTTITLTYRRELPTPESKREFKNEIDTVLDPFRAEGLKFQIIGLPLVEHEVRTTLISDVKWFLPASLALLVTILAFGLRSPALILYTLISQIFGMLLVAGAIQMTGFQITIFTVMLFPVIAAIHLTLLTHVTTGLQRAQGPGPARPVEEMLNLVFRSCLFAALTTGVGLLSLTISDVRQVREFGLLGAMGTALVFVFTFGPGVSLLKICVLRTTRNQRGPTACTTEVGEREKRTGFVVPFLAAIQKRRRPVITGAVLLMCFSALGICKLRTDVRAVEFLSPSSPTRQAVEMFDRKYGGINIVQIQIDTGQTNGVNRPPFLGYLQDLQKFAEAQPEVSGVYSYAQLLALMNQIWEEEAPGSLRVPDSPLLLNVFVLALQSQDYPFTRALADENLRTTQLIVRTPDMTSQKYLEVIDRIVAQANATKPDGIEVSAREGLHTILEADRKILRSQIQTAGVTVVVITLVLAVLWKSPGLAMVATGVNFIPVALVLAVAGLADVPMNSITIMVAAIAFGIAVDDSVHFVTQWRRQLSFTSDPKEAFIRTFRIKGRPIVYTSIILTGIFGLFLHSSFPPVAHFGFLSALAFIFALISVLVLLPALLMGRMRSP